MKFKEEHDIKIVTIKDLIEYRRKNESLIDRVTEAEMPTKHGNFKMVGFIDKTTGEHHIALVKGDVSQEGSDDAEPVLVRVHSECLTGDAFGSCRCDCGTQLDNALDQINKKGRGILVYMRQEGRGIGLINKIKAYALQDQGYDTVEANVMLGFEEDLRDYGIGAQIIRSLGVSRIELMTNNPKKIIGIEGYGIEVVRRVPVFYGYTPENKCYLETKKDKMGHIYEEEA